jgi:hypothetical protein
MPRPIEIAVARVDFCTMSTVRPESVRATGRVSRLCCPCGKRPSSTSRRSRPALGRSPATPTTSRACVKCSAAKRLHVVERDRVDARDSALRGVTVARALEQARLQRFLAEFLVVVRAQVLHERVARLLLDALEVVLAPARGDELRQHHVEVRSRLSAWIEPLKVVISRSTKAPKPPAIGNSASSISSILRSALPPFAIIAAVSAARPSLPTGIVGGTARNCSLNVSWRLGLASSITLALVSRVRPGRAKPACRRALAPLGRAHRGERRHDQARVGEVLRARGLRLGRRDRVVLAEHHVERVERAAEAHVARERAADRLGVVERTRVP